MENTNLAIETSNSVTKIDKKIFNVMAKAPVISKDGVNPHFRSKYAEYPEIQAVIKPLLFEAQLMVNFMPITGNRLTMYIKDIEAAEFYKVTAELNMGAISPQAQGSAITYLKRYMLTAFFDLQIDDASDDDGNAGSGKVNGNATSTPATQTQQAAPVANLPWLNKDTPEWLTAKNYIFNAGKTIKDIQKKFKINKANLEMLPKIEPLKPGANIWVTATMMLNSNKLKPENIINMFEISESDMQDLLIDATNYTAPATTENPNTNTTK